MMTTDGYKTRLCAFSFGLAFGITDGLLMMLFAWAGAFFHYGIPMIKTMGEFYYGYAPTVMGGLFGGLWGLLIGFVFGFILAAIYNFCLCRCCGNCAPVRKDVV